MVEGDHSRADKIDKNLAMFKYIKKLSKAKISIKRKRLEQPIFLNSKASRVLFIKDNSNRYLQVIVKALPEKLIV